MDAELLIVAGGGGGGMAKIGGAGGAGGLIHVTVDLSTLMDGTVVVGAGGVAGSTPTNGGNSSFPGYATAAVGGGAGARGNYNWPYPGADGGSGGGGGGTWGTSTTPPGGSGVEGQGYAGGNGLTTAVTVYLASGGGGGAGGAGVAAANSVGGAGGVGVQIDITGSSAWYAGGGGGGSAASSGRGLGGSGVGGNGGDDSNAPTAGVANTGSGGGGGSETLIGGAGGSGIVVLRYYGEQVCTGGTVSSVDGYTIHVWTESGSFAIISASISVLAALVGQYDDFHALVAGLVGLYDSSSLITSAFIGSYSLIMETAMIARYGDAPVRIAGLVGRYGNSALVRAALVGKYGDMVRLAAALIGRYDILHQVVSGLVGKYAVTGTEIMSALDGRYDLRERDAILAALEGYYSIMPDALIQQLSFSVIIGGVVVDVADATWTESEDSYLVEASITLRDPAQWAVVSKQDTVSITWMETTWHLFVAAKLRTRSISGGPGSSDYWADYTVVARSLSVALDAPYALPVTMSWDAPTMASNIAADLIAGMEDVVSIDFQLEDWLQPGGTFFVTDQSPLEGLRSLAALVGGIIQTAPDNGIVLRMADQVAPAAWNTASPSWTIEDSGVFADAETEQATNKYNVITVTNQGQSSDSTSFEVEEITAYRKTVKGYRVPWSDFSLATSGGSWVTIDDLGVIEEQVEEEVEFVDGAGSAAHPIYSAVSVIWQEDSLGAVTGAEDGTLTAAVAGCSRATITYTTKYHAWIGASNRDETVQFYQVEI